MQMSTRKTQLNQLKSLPITWLSEGRLKFSILLRHESASSGRASEALKLLTQDAFIAERVFSAFPSIREPNSDLLERASDDYLRCILAKSLSEVYRKITPKYRNEAARKQFFKRSLTYP